MKKRFFMFFVLFILYGAFHVFLFTSYTFWRTNSSANTKTRNIKKQHQTITEAYRIRTNIHYTDTIPAYESVFYQLSASDSLEIRVQTDQSRSISFEIFDAGGNHLSAQKASDPKEIRISFSSSKARDYIFLKLANKSTGKKKINLSYYHGKQKSKAKKIAKKRPEKKEQQSTKSANTRKPTKTSKEKSSLKPASPEKTPEQTEPAKRNQKQSENPVQEKKPASLKEIQRELFIKPHFIRIKPGEKKSLEPYIFSQPSNLQEFPKPKNLIWISTKKSVAIVKNGILFAKKPGIAILYIQYKEKSSLKTSVLIKVST